mmetsp:Transcript_17754/g.58414  ORF Transcript_17754/g.58414 Transcript_17754/m.58414 type:complete len:307 (-) Transcript_17754:2009-2929(-)
MVSFHVCVWYRARVALVLYPSEVYDLVGNLLLARLRVHPLYRLGVLVRALIADDILRRPSDLPALGTDVVPVEGMKIGGQVIITEDTRAEVAAEEKRSFHDGVARTDGAAMLRARHRGDCAYPTLAMNLAKASHQRALHEISTLLPAFDAEVVKNENFLLLAGLAALLVRHRPVDDLHRETIDLHGSGHGLSLGHLPRLMEKPFLSDVLQAFFTGELLPLERASLPQFGVKDILGGRSLLQLPLLVVGVLNHLIDVLHRQRPLARAVSQQHLLHPTAQHISHPPLGQRVVRIVLGEAEVVLQHDLI